MLEEILKSIDNELLRLEIFENFNPPLADVEMKILSDSFAFTLPKSIKTIYTWHNGGLDIFLGHYFLPLAESSLTCKALLKLVEEDEDEEIFGDSFFPMFQDQNWYFVVDCREKSNLELYEMHAVDLCLSPMHICLVQFFEFILECLTAEAIYLKNGKIFSDDKTLAFLQAKYNLHM